MLCVQTAFGPHTKLIDVRRLICGALDMSKVIRRPFYLLVRSLQRIFERHGKRYGLPATDNCLLSSNPNTNRPRQCYCTSI